MSDLIHGFTGKGAPRNLFHTVGVLLYLLLGMASAWHAPHFFRNGVSLDADRHASHESVAAGACALCNAKPASQLVGSGFFPPVVSFARGAMEAFEIRCGAVEAGFSARPRAPPARS